MDRREKTMIIILIGESGCGKDTQRRCLEGMDCIPMVSSTTRPMRQGEIQGREYNFISEQEFEKKIETGEIFEYRAYESAKGKVYYGSEKIYLRNDCTYVKVLDTDGAREYINAYGRENCFVVHIDTKEYLRRNRALERAFGSDKPDEESLKGFNAEWKQRVRDDSERFSENRMKDIVNFTVDGSLEKNEITENISEALYEYMNSIELFRNTHTGNVPFPQYVIRATEGIKFGNNYKAFSNNAVNDNNRSYTPRNIENLCSLENNVGSVDVERYLKTGRSSDIER